MNKGQMKRDADTHAVLRRIEARWKCVERARAWTDIPKQDRDRVLADIEEDARSNSDDGRLSEAATAALDALESIHDLVALFGLHTAGPDVHALIAIARGDEPDER